MFVETRNTNSVIASVADEPIPAWCVLFVTPLTGNQHLNY
jgi:hypothetical protein